MNEQVEQIGKGERHYEGKYRYLADFSKQEPSPNLRVHYHDSFSKRSNSYERRSPPHSRERRSSYKKSQERQQASNHHYSPSCSTFNPRRETTQEEFSPYDERAEKEEERLSKELLEENAQLRAELSTAQQTVEGLRAEVGRKETEVVKLREMAQADLRYFQKVVGEMTNEIQIVLTKNKMLENQLVAVKAQLQEEYIRQEEVIRFEEQRRRHQQYRRREQGRRYEDQRRTTPQHATKRSVGKVMNRPTNHPQESLGTSKIKIEQQCEAINQSCFDGYKGVDNRAVLDKQARKSEELIGSIKSMQFKITGEQAGSLRELWKWLKGIGHSHSCLKRWKAKASETAPINPEKLKDLIREACGYIQ